MVVGKIDTPVKYKYLKKLLKYSNYVFCYLPALEKWRNQTTCLNNSVYFSCAYSWMNGLTWLLVVLLVHSDQTWSCFDLGKALTMRPPVFPGHNKAGKQTHKYTQLCDAGASCGASSAIWPLPFAFFCWVELIEPLHHSCGQSGLGVTAVTHFPCIFNHLYGTCLTSAPQLMYCHHSDWPPCATNRAECRLNYREGGWWGWV